MKLSRKILLAALFLSSTSVEVFALPGKIELDDVTTVEQARVQLQNLFFKAQTDKSVAKQYNLLFLKAHQLRLNETIENLMGKIASDDRSPQQWIKKSNEKLLTLKQNEIDLISKVREKILVDSSNDRIFHYFPDLRQYLSDASIPSLAQIRQSSRGRTGETISQVLLVTNTGIEDKTKDESEYFNVRLKDSVQKNQNSFSKPVDLSASFFPSRSQRLSSGYVTKACAAYAITSDMEFTGHTPQLSAGLAYGMIRAVSELNYDRGFLPNDHDTILAFEKNSPGLLKRNAQNLPDNLDQAIQEKLNTNANSSNYLIDIGTTLFAAAETLKYLPVAPEAHFPSRKFLPASLDAIQNRNYLIGSFKSTTDKKYMTLENLNLLLRTKNPPIAVIASDQRVEDDEWMEPIYESDFFNKPTQHIVNIVGRTTAIDPFDLRRKTVFLVRDSLGTMPIHYTVDAIKYMTYIQQLAKVRSVINLEGRSEAF